MFAYVAIILFTTISSSIEHDDCPDPPKDCPGDKIKFFLYTSVEKPPTELILSKPETIKEAEFNKGDFKFMIHGYTEWKNNVNWIVLREVSSLEKIGECATDLLRQILKEKSEINLDRFHFIGFSLGAQICAQISNCLRPSKMKIRRISGCDPALPGFTVGARDEDSVLNSQHANIVDVIHSNKGNFGVLYSSAHYDIYAEDGYHQPGCDLLDIPCSHCRALQIFPESVNSSTEFFARKCDSKFLLVSANKCTGDHKATLEVGEHCPKPKSKEEEGLYRFRTHDKAPYAKRPPKP